MSRRPARRAPRESGPSGPAGAGALLIATIVACAAVGLGLGALIGAPLALALAGGAIGVLAGFWVVYSRFKEL